ncbi:hypothetical protein F4825DRAFT_425610 [Nemania diffusa]|nr:hypothetical protein F4825DRAFT_425610 [Nemania diffusa]
MSLAPPSLPQHEAKCVPPIPVPTHGPGGLFSVACSTRIAGPPLAALEKVLDLASYSAWNAFIPTASITSPPPPSTDLAPPELRDLAARPGYAAPGAKIRFDAVMVPGGAARAVDIEVTALEAFETGEGKRGYRVAWKALGLPYFLLRSERVQEFVEVEAEDGSGRVETQYACWETFGGLLGYVLPRAQLEDGFGRWMGGLKKVVEGGE